MVNVTNMFHASYAHQEHSEKGYYYDYQQKVEDDHLAVTVESKIITFLLLKMLFFNNTLPIRVTNTLHM